MQLIDTIDGSNTSFNAKYNQHYHNIKDGAFNETLYKHIKPAFEHSIKQNKKELNILDICFGLGYNTFMSIVYLKEQNLNIKLNIYSVELDIELLEGLIEFQYPKEFKIIEDIIQTLLSNIDLDNKIMSYKDEQITIKIYLQDAKEYVKTLEKGSIDIVYQDPFSKDVNPELWTEEYFKDIYQALNDDGILTTYSVASSVKSNLVKNNFYIYKHRNDFTRSSTLALKN
jgi:tRNA U34 5-methylaminomethyl-2-thiouridine-forming methyltransferase MnmC